MRLRQRLRFIIAPDGCDWTQDRQQLWQTADAAEKRVNSTLAREWLVSLPHELSPEARHDLARDFAQELVDRYGFVADVSIHPPSKLGDGRNHHAHILCTTRRATPDGLGAKTRILDARQTGPREVEHMRSLYRSTEMRHGFALKRPWT